MNLKKNKKILLIGSEGVLGSFFAKNLSRENDMLFVADIKIKKDKIKKNKIDFKLNLESENEIKNLFLNIKKKYGEIDVLVNNAALTTEGVKKLFGSEIKKEEFNTAIWDKTININMRGVFLSCKYFFKYHHNKNKLQKIINFGSIYGSYSPHHEIYERENFFSSISYTASKSGIIGLTKWLATKYIKENTSCNVISPAGVFNYQPKSFLKKYLNLIPSGKMAEQKDIFEILSLIINSKSNYLNGQNIHVDGGFSSW